MAGSEWAGLRWRKSSASGLNGCVEIGCSNGCVLIRDSTCPSEGVLALDCQQWLVFVREAKDGRFDLEGYAYD